MKGPLKPEQEIGVYHHLLWIDTSNWVLEPPKFEKGKRYAVFLIKGSTSYELTDQWLAVLPEHPHLDRDVAYALNDVGDLLGGYSRRQNKGAVPSRRRIDLVPEPEVAQTDKGLILTVRITNHSSQEIRTRLAHEWQGGEAPPTDLYASFSRSGKAARTV